jgi:MFS transporter, DHA3 family, macrolide efflux protein
MSFSFLREMRTFLIIWAGQLVSSLGSGLTSFAFGVWVYQKSGSTTLFALNILAFTLPGIIFSPLIGSIVDRYDRRWLMILSDMGSGFVTLGIWGLFLSGNLTPWFVLGGSFINATFGSLQWSAHSAATTMLVPKEHLGRASGMVAASDGISTLVAPLLAGALYVSIGLAGIALIDFFTFGVAMFTLLLIRIPHPTVSEEGRRAGETFWHKATFGWKYVAARKGLQGLLIYFAGLYFILGLVDPLLQTMLLDLGGPQALGSVLSVMGGGYLVGTLVMSAWGGPRRRSLGILFVGIAQGLVMIIYGITPSVLIIGAAVCLFSLLDPVVGTSSQALWQTKVPPDIQGRVFAVRRMISRSGLAASLLLAGPLEERVFRPLLMEGGALAGSLGRFIGVGPGRGAGFLFMIMGVVFTLFSLAGLLYRPLRRLDLEEPDGH